MYAASNYFVYHDNRVRIATELEGAGDPILEDSITVTFDSTGYATCAGGYRLCLMRPKYDPAAAMTPRRRQMMHLKVVNVTRLGRTFLWKTLTKSEEETLEGEECL